VSRLTPPASSSQSSGFIPLKIDGEKSLQELSIPNLLHLLELKKKELSNPIFLNPVLQLYILLSFFELTPNLIVPQAKSTFKIT
jgi:hypothetical protein